MNTASNSLPLPETGSPFASALLFALPALALAGATGIGAVQLAVPLLALLRLRLVRPIYSRHGYEFAGVIAAFCACFVLTLLHPMPGRPTQVAPAALALLGLASVGVMAHLRPRPRQLWSGLCAAAVLASLLALYHMSAATDLPGAAREADLALVFGLMSLCGLGALRGTRLAWLPVVAMLCGVSAFAFAGSGGWLALPLALIPLLVYARALPDRRPLALCALVFVLACVAPAIGMGGRVDVALEQAGRHLAAAGLVDIALLLVLYLAPLYHFVAELRRPDRGQRPLALAGMVLVAAFAGLGLYAATATTPALLPAPFYILMVGVLSGLCLAARHNAPPRRIMITRTDNIGDVVLTLSLAGYLKQIYPQAEIVFLCRRYAAAVVGQCRHVDRVLTLEDLGDDTVGGMVRSACDTVLFAFPRRPLAIAALRAGIERRVGSSRRVYHWFTSNRLINISAKKTPLHEAQLSFKLLLPLGIDHVPTLEEVWRLYGLDTPRHPAADAVLAAPGFKLILHPKSNGNGREWPLQHYTTLARMLGGAGHGVRVLVTGSAAEGELLAQQAPELLALPHVENLCGRLDLEGFTALIGGCDGLVASGTGPLHLAAALGRPVVGLFPPLKPIDPSRWAALGQRATNLVHAQGCAHCADPARCTCMLAIAPQQVLDVVRTWRAEAALAAA